MNKIYFLIIGFFITTFLFLSIPKTYAIKSGEICFQNLTQLGQCDAPHTCTDQRKSDPDGTYRCTTPTSGVFGKINPPQAISNIGFGAVGINNVLNRIIELIFIIASIVFIFMVVISAFQWITSGGDKEGIGKARGRLTATIIGLVLLALAFVIIKLVGQITGFELFRGQNNP